LPKANAKTVITTAISARILRAAKDPYVCVAKSLPSPG